MLFRSDVQTQQVPWAEFEEGELESKEAAIAYAVRAVFDFSPQGIIERFGLRSPIFEQTARDGHVGIPELPWEEESAVTDLLLTEFEAYQLAEISGSWSDGSEFRHE